jgi:hypothetical protein
VDAGRGRPTGHATACLRRERKNPGRGAHRERGWRARENSGTQEKGLVLIRQESQRSLYDRLGGIYSIAVVIDDFVDRVMKDAA